ncbi:MAG: HAD family phosphatase [Eubacteriales bacterium]|nr:HAD family phosphatase [Eubacteriales bacterium]
MKKDFSCAIFDLDGTLLNSCHVWEEIDREFLRKRNIPITEEFEREIKLHTFETGSVYVVEKYGLNETPQQVMKEWYDMAIVEYANTIDLKPNAAKYLRQLKNNGIKLSVATSADKVLFEPCLKRNGIYELFDCFTQTSEVKRGKRFPDVYLKAAEKCGCDVDECVVFEDILSAVKSSKSGGFYTVAVYDDISKKDWNKIMQVSDYYVYDYGDIM